MSPTLQALLEVLNSNQYVVRLDDTYELDCFTVTSAGTIDMVFLDPHAFDSEIAVSVNDVDDVAVTSECVVITDIETEDVFSLYVYKLEPFSLHTLL